MSKKPNKTKEEPFVPIDRPYWVDEKRWESLTPEERQKLVQQN